MKSILFRLVVLLVMIGVSYGLVLYTNDGQRLVSSIKQKIEIEAPVKETIAKGRVMELINQWRLDNKLPRVKDNETLDKAALAKISVVISSDDYDGSITGLTTEKAVENNGYNFAEVGSLYALDLSSEKELVENWVNDSEGKKILSEKKFVDMGVSVTYSVNGTQILVILAYKQNVKQKAPEITWGGPELWEAVNKRRIERGVNALSKKDELCTIASIRLNQLLELNNLDGHAGFVPTLDRLDLKWIKDKYDISEFLIMGYQTPLAAVDAWEHTLGHKELLTGGQFVWGCIYAQDTFGVAITAF